MHDILFVLQGRWLWQGTRHQSFGVRYEARLCLLALSGAVCLLTLLINIVVCLLVMNWTSFLMANHAVKKLLTVRWTELHKMFLMLSTSLCLIPNTAAVPLSMLSLQKRSRKKVSGNVLCTKLYLLSETVIENASSPVSMSLRYWIIQHCRHNQQPTECYSLLSLAEYMLPTGYTLDVFTVFWWE